MMLLAILLATTSVPAITLGTVYAKEPLWGRTVVGVSWSPDGERFLYVRPSQDPSENLPLMLYAVRNQRSQVWIKAGAFRETPGVLGWSPDGRTVALLADGTLYSATVANPRPQKIADDVDDARWSPRGDEIAYSHRADLYVYRLGDGRVTRLTRAGIPDVILNGSLDWVYPEELGIEHGFAWSPDGTRIAYLTMDERRVTDFPIVDFLSTRNSVDRERYPLAGEMNPRVSLRLVDVATGSDRLVYDASTRDEYVAAFDWVPHANSLEAEILDRPQRTMRFARWDDARGAPALLYYQASATWVDVQPLPVWASEGRSIWLLDRARTAGIYLRERDGSMRKLTGNYRVTDLYGVAGRTIYAGAAYPTRRDRSLLAISFDGGVTNLTRQSGWHAVVPAPTMRRFVDTYSRLNDPPRVDVTDSRSHARRSLVPERAALRGALLPARMFEVPSQYGPLDAIEIDPPGFDPAKRYPVVMYAYGGPDAPTTADRFGGLYDQLLARAGFVVVSIDGPASQVDDDDHVRLLFHNFGPGSLAGQEIGARYLARLPYVDASRIGVWGWSFGGYETCFALTHSRLFAAGAAVAPVTDWHFYDSIYTERYMGLPHANAAAYAKSSVLDAAGRLHGPLLIQHGTADDNVHMANTVALLQRFILARETRVQFFPYPRKTHPIRGLLQQRSVFARMLEFWKTVFSSPAAATEP